MGDALAKCAKYNKNGVCIVYKDQRITWADLYVRVERLACSLSALGVKKEDKVIIMFHNTPLFFEANYAIQILGAIPVPMNYRFSPKEIIYQTNHSGAKMFIMEDLWLELVLIAKPELNNIKNFILAGKTEKGMLDYESLINNPPKLLPRVNVNKNDICVICYTGGTTGMPKGVMLTYANHIHLLYAFFETIIDRIGDINISVPMKKKLDKTPFKKVIAVLQSGLIRWILKRSLVKKIILKLIKLGIGSSIMLRLGAGKEIKQMMPSFPMFHDAAYQMSILGPILGNMTMIFLKSPKFDPVEVLKLVENQRPIILGNVPTGWKMLLDCDEIDDYDLSSVFLSATGGGVCPASLKKNIFEKFSGAAIADIFGQTEMTPSTSMRIDLNPGTLKDRSVGKPMVKTRVVDENGHPVKDGEIGEIIYKSPTIMKGYLDEPDKTGEVIKDGWFYSGDLGFIDKDGDLCVVERKKECISSGGEKIFPGEIEEVLSKQSKVEKVCVIGVADKTWGTSVRAVVLLKENEIADENEIIEWCRQNLAGYKRPRSVVFVDSLPVSVVGKIQRNKVREMYGAGDDD